MKKDYQKPTIESVVILKKQHLLAGSPCNQDTVGTCDTYQNLQCPNEIL